LDNITILKPFEKVGIGKIRIALLNNEPMFNLYDTCFNLGYARPNSKGTIYLRKDKIVNICESLDITGVTPSVTNKMKITEDIDFENTWIKEQNFYDLCLESHAKNARPFRMWVTGDVLPQIRKTGEYSIEVKSQQKLANAIKVEIASRVDEIVANKINEIENKCSKYYRPASIEKYNISQYIKKRLGINRANEEYELVKQRVLIKLGGTKWEDIPVEILVNSLNIIDESIRIIKADRKYDQVSIFD